MLGIFFKISSDIRPGPNFFAMSPCIQTAAQHARKGVSLFLPTKLAVIPHNTSPDPITASSLDVWSFITIFPVGEHIKVVDPLSIILHLHIF